MSLFKRLFERRSPAPAESASPAPPAPPAAPRPSADESWWPERPKARSPDGTWRYDATSRIGTAVIGSDGTQTGASFAARARLLGPDGSIPLPGLESPENGIVTNDGEAVVLDWLVRKKSAGRIVVFGRGGQQLAAHDVSANLDEIQADYAAGIAFVRTCSASYTSHSNRLFAVRIADGALLWKSRCEVRDFDLDGGKRVVRLLGTPGGLAYDTGKSVRRG